MPTPSSQKADVCPISFVLSDERSGRLTYVPLVIRPEELTRPEPALITPMQTFGGAWMDDWGPGLSTIQISGHTGWRGTQTADGAASWFQLRDSIWVQWHALRKNAVSQGKSPDTIKLIFSDKLNRIVAVVAPTGGIVLKRSKSRPLLYMYQLSMTVLSDQVSPTVTDFLALQTQGKPGSPSIPAGVSSLQNSLNTLQQKAATLRNFINANVAQPLSSLMNLSSQAMASVNSVVDPIRGVVTAEAQQLTGIASDLSQVGRNVFHAYNAVANLPDFVSNEISAVAREFENSYCILSNVLTRQPEYPDYSGLYGSSACSSTLYGGSSAFAGANPFDAILDTPPSTVSVSQAARDSISLLKHMDPVLSPLGTNDLIASIGPINSGVTLAAVAA